MVDGNDLIIGGEKYEGTRGLWELIVSNEPSEQNYDDGDLATYSEIMVNTNAIRRDNDPTNPRPKSSRSWKWTNVVKDIWYNRNTYEGQGTKTIVIPSDPNALLSLSFGLYKIGSIRRYLDQSATERLIHAFVMSRIDNCNGLLYGLSDLLLGRLQRIRNSAARHVTRTRSHESIFPRLHTLHWLPVKDRLVFKLLIIAYKCQHHLCS